MATTVDSMKIKTTCLVLILILVLGILLSVHVRMLTGLTDDAYISFRYSKNLAQGQGFRWNPGGEKVEGLHEFLMGTDRSPGLSAAAGQIAAGDVGIGNYFSAGDHFDLFQDAGPFFPR